AQHQDQEADDGRQHRPADENVGELHHAACRFFGLCMIFSENRHPLFGIRLYRSSGTLGAASAVGITELSISTVEPLCSVSWPEVTIMSPSLTPLSTATWSPRVEPVVTKLCRATSCGLPSAPAPL